MNAPNGLPQGKVASALAALSDNAYLSAIRAGMVTIVPLTIVGGLVTAFIQFPIKGWDERVKAAMPAIEVPVLATFGLLAVFVCLAIAYDLAQRLKQEPVASATIAVLVFFLLQLEPGSAEKGLSMAGLGSAGIFTAIVVALITVRVQKAFTDRNWVIRLPSSVPPVVSESFLAIVPMVALVAVFWAIRFQLGIDLNARIQQAFSPLVFALNTLPGILTYAFLVTLLWSFGINGDNAMDAIVAPIFLNYLTVNTSTVAAGGEAPYITALGFFTSFVNVGGTGATLALALVMLRSRDEGYRKVARLSLPTQVFQINEPIFFGFPIVLNPVFMIPYILNALLLTATTYLLMDAHIIQRPFVSVPWTTPPVIGHFLSTGGDWRAAVWGVVSILMAMAVYYPFARAAERQRHRAQIAAASSEPVSSS